MTISRLSFGRRSAKLGRLPAGGLSSCATNAELTKQFQHRARSASRNNLQEGRRGPVRKLPPHLLDRRWLHNFR
eukprot:9478993-Pyramimonas_sp.AAC.1